jgi:hypothetical protein
MKKIIAVLLFVMIVSNKGFSQEVIITHGTQVLKFDDYGKTYYNSKLFNEINIFNVDKNFIKVICSNPNNRDTVYTIIEDCGEVKTSEDKSKWYVCKDLDGGTCWIYITTEIKKDQENTIEIQYANSSIVYYVVK